MSLSPDVARMKRELADLVAIDTQNPPGHEAAAAQFLRSLLMTEGFDVALQEYKPERINVVARIENGAGPVFAFNTHMDVVPVGEGWSSDPFVLKEADGRLYGRGACDCKAPLAAMLEAMRMLSAERTAWSGTLLGVFVADEEIASDGARFYASSTPKIDAAVVGEPTSNATFTAHKGSLRPVVRVHGVSAHSGTPHLGDNALPAACDLVLDRRMVPGEDEEAVKREIGDLLALARERFGVRAEIVGYRATTGGATETALDTPIVQASLAASRTHGVAKPGPFGFQGGCDLVHFRKLGAQGTVIGPGDLAVAHKPDEFVPVDEFVIASLIYRDVAKAMLRNGD